MSPIAHLRSASQRRWSTRHTRRHASPQQPNIETLEQRELPAAGLGTIPGLTDSPTARYVTSLYHDLLQRVPLADEIRGWVASLDAGRGYDEIVRGILASAEYRHQFIENTYVHLLGRAPAGNEVDLWSHALAAGLTEKQFQVQFLTSDEYQARQTARGSDWLNGLYQDTLGRAPDATGLAVWHRALQQGATSAAVAQGILDSAEAGSRVVAEVYQGLLGRAPDATGLATFVPKLSTGLTTTEFRAFVASSPEYIAAQNSNGGSAAGTPPPVGPVRFDFGTPTSPVAAGYTRVPLMIYSQKLGYGWGNTTSLLLRDRGTADPLTRDNHLGKDNTFRAKVANGTYNVTVTLGDAMWARTNMSIWAEGVRVASNLATGAGQFIHPTFRVTIADGRLDLRLTGPSDDYFAITGIDINPITTNPMPSLTVNAGPDQTSNEGSAVQFTAAATGFSTLTYSWNFGDGTSASTLSPAHTYTDNGTYTATLTVKDGTGATKQDSVVVTVRNVAPTVSAGSGYTATGQTPISFRATVVDPSTADTAVGFQYAWNFGDGTSSTASAPSHAYAQEGTYTVALTVTDKDGAAATSTTTATVSPTLPPPVPPPPPPPEHEGEHDPGDVIHTHHDDVPNFGANPTIVSIHSGAWSDVHTWSAGRLPGAGDVVAIAANTTVTYDLVSDVHLQTVVVQAGGHMKFKTDVNTKIIVGNFLVLEGGELEVGTVATPIRADVTAKILIADQALDLDMDPRQLGTGLIVLGKVSMHGAGKSPTFVRLAVEPKAGDWTLTLAQPVSGWRPGDVLVLPDSRQLTVNQVNASDPYQIDELTLQSVSADGKVLTLASPLQYHHPGARNADGVLEFLPHVNNVTRNVVIESENPMGTRGHTMFLHRADVDLRYTAFRALGRTQLRTIDDSTFDATGHTTHIGTNQKGRYPLHIHHVMGPTTVPANGYQYTLLGNAVDGVNPTYGDPKWGIAIHDSHYGLIQDNVIYKAKGAGVAFEDGSESFNVVQHNSVVRVHGQGGRADRAADPLNSGLEGSGFWFRGPNNYVRDNVVSDVRSDIITNHAYIYTFVYLGHLNIPAFKGADVAAAGQYRTVNMNATPLLQFQGNEAYGYMNSGLTIWWLGTFGLTVNQETGQSVLKDFRVWNVTYNGMYLYENNNLLVDGYVIRGQGGAGIFHSDYLSYNLTIRNANIQGMDIGWGATPITGGGTLTIENSYLRNVVDVAIPNMWTSSHTSEGLQPRKIIIRNVKFDTRAPSWSFETPLDIRMDYDAGGVRDLVQTDEIFVYDFNQVAGDNFRLYYAQQAANYVVPQTTYNPDGSIRLHGAPVAGLTNQQAWAQYLIAIGGAVAPTTAQTRTGIGYGLVAPI